ncbi:MAG: hypothetical protein AAB407_02265 [Patescibacteria group bacterium]
MQLPKRKKDLIFIGTAVFIAGILFFYSFLTIRFLGIQVKSAVSTSGSGSALPVRFDFDTLNRILDERGISIQSPVGL